MRVMNRELTVAQDPGCLRTLRADRPGVAVRRSIMMMVATNRALSHTMRFESHFKSYFGNVKAFNLKKIEIIAEPVAAMAGGGLRLGGDGRRIP